MKQKIKSAVFFVVVALLFSTTVTAQQNKDLTLYQGGEAYEVKSFTQTFKSDSPKNVVLFIGDGMGVAHFYAGLTANRGDLFIQNCKYIGFSKTYSSNRYVTDSAAGATAISTGTKTYNGAIGVGPDKNPIKTILEEASEKGLATGLVSTSSITHATPASFIAHQASRSQEEDIAADFLKTDIDVFIGGGYDFFTKREDGRNLVNELMRKGYTIERELSKIENYKGKKLAGLTAPKGNPRMSERGNMLPISTHTAIKILQQNEKGFFLMVEGSFIDSGGHGNNTVQVVEEMLDFDQAVGKALEFAAENGETLVIITADHETGGMTINDGSFETGMVKGAYTSTGHTGVMVPIFAYGPGASEFIGIMENTDIHAKIKKLLLKK
ncbi:MAG: Alkaline phosphatase 3 precursor [Bacteroidetes bacterium ADurb.BinA174]|nr:MAG: Alkaline phosphatase 3 precursor [Bacteroidetes bacterium ADurb.BinA174]